MPLDDTGNVSVRVAPKRKTVFSRLGKHGDFFYFELIDFPIFNVADIYVTVAAIFLILLILFYYKEADLEMMFHLFSHKNNNGSKQERAL